MNYADSITYMNGLLRFGEKYGNERFEELLRRLDSPHLKLRAIHIAGTKGKGSTTTFASSILISAGYRTGSYLSPYVYDLRERIQIDGEMIPQGEFARLVTEIEPIANDLSLTEFGQPTEFEVKTAVAFCHFAEQQVDYAVVEVGLGGRLDATNVLPFPLVSVITNIGYDHMEILGDTLELIAAEKAGIIKDNGICVTGIPGGPALQTVEDISQKRNAVLHQVLEGKDWFSEADGALTIKSPLRTLSRLKLRLRGRFQHANAALALFAIDYAQIPDIDDEAAKRGLESAFAPGRLEVAHLESPTVVLDAAHNELAAQVLAEALTDEFRAKSRPLIFVIGFSRRHDPSDLLKTLLPLKPIHIIATEPSFHPRPAEDTLICAIALGFDKAEIVREVPKALERAIAVSESLDHALIVVTGSFFTVGDLPPVKRKDMFHQV